MEWGLRSAGRSLPFEESITDEDSTALLKGLPKHGLIERFLGPGVYRGDLGLLGFVPEGYQTPAHKCYDGACRIVGPNDRDELRRSDVEALAKGRFRLDVEAVIASQCFRDALGID